MSLWLLEYIRKKSFSRGRLIGFILLIVASLLFFGLAVRLNSEIVYSVLIGLPISFLTFCFGIGFRVGKGLKYLVYGALIVLIIVIIALVYNAIQR